MMHSSNFSKSQHQESHALRESVGGPKNAAGHSMEPYACMKQAMLGATAKNDRYKKAAPPLQFLLHHLHSSVFQNQPGIPTMEKNPLFDLEEKVVKFMCMTDLSGVRVASCKYGQQKSCICSPCWSQLYCSVSSNRIYQKALTSVSLHVLGSPLGV